jgi:hypothetical protein
MLCTQLRRAETFRTQAAFRSWARAFAHAVETKGHNMKDQRPSQGSGTGGSKPRVQGEGDYESARVYKKDIDQFVSSHKDEIPDLAKSAEDSLEGPEGEELKRAEEKGKAKARR